MKTARLRAVLLTAIVVGGLSGFAGLNYGVLPAIMCVLTGSIGFLFGLHTNVRVDLGEGHSVTRHHRRTILGVPPDPVVIPRFPLVIIGILFTVIMLGTSASAIKATLSANDAKTSANQTAEDLTTYVACQYQFLRDLVNSLQSRSKPTPRVFNALDIIIDGVVLQDPDRVSKGLVRYQNVRDRQKTQLGQNPIPPLPKKLCGSSLLPENKDQKDDG